MPQEVALLLTDIVDSTLLTEQLGDESISAVWRSHDRASRDLLLKWRGAEINRSDGFLLRFERAADAAGYAIDYHRSLRALPRPLKARVAMHVGRVVERINPETDLAIGAKLMEVAGIAISVVARVMALARPGQTLITAASESVLAAGMFRMQSHGHWRFKGIDEPVELFELGDADAPFEPPEDGLKGYRVAKRNQLWIPERDITHTLPSERNSFVGRNKELQKIELLVDRGARFVTVVGTGGVGKTRLAQHFGWSRLGLFPGGVWFCDFSHATSTEGIWAAASKGLGITLGPEDAADQIGHAMAGRHNSLVIFDNVEQIVPIALELFGGWLDRASRTTFLCTSRSLVGAPGESSLFLEPLTGDEGAALFVDRAAAAGAESSVISEDRPALDVLVELLDGLPLAIELAAARTRLMSTSSLVLRMRERFRLLRSSTGRADRHSTLKATCDWSWNLLSPNEKAALAQVSAFDGGFSLMAFERVVRAGCADTDDGLDLLQSLVDKSWITPVRSARFKLLKTINDYASEMLATEYGGPEKAAVEARHWNFFARLDEDGVTADQCVELDNLVTALRRALRCSEAEVAAAALSNVWLAIERRGPYGIVASFAKEVLGLPGLSNPSRARALWVAGSAFQSLGDVEAAATSFTEGLGVAVACNDQAQRARLLCAIGEQETKLGKLAEASEHLQTAHGLSVELNSPLLQCVTLNALGTLEQSSGNNEAALTAYSSAYQIADGLNHLRWKGGLLGNMGIARYSLGNLEAAEPLYRGSLEIATSLGDSRWMGNARSNLGLLLSDKGDFVAATLELTEAVKLARHVGHARLEYIATWNLALIARKDARCCEAQALFREALEMASRLKDSRAVNELQALLVSSKVD